MTVGLQTDPAWRGDAPIPKEVKLGGTAWPRMIVLDEDAEKRLIEFLDYEIRLAFQEREPLVDDWIAWQSDYWAKPESKEKNFPFKRAANIVVPLTAIAVEAIYARLMNTMFSVEPFWSIRPKSADWVDAAPCLQDWMQTEGDMMLDVYGFCQNAIMELVKLGTGVAKSGYDRQVRKSLTTLTSQDGTTREVERWVEVYNGATLDHVPLVNFLIRLQETDPQTALWVGEEHSFTWSQLKQMCASGQYKPDIIEKIKAYWATRAQPLSSDGKYLEAMDKASNTEPTWYEAFKIQEIWLHFDVDGDGYDEEIVIDFHKDSRNILSARYNWYDDCHRPYRIGVYIPVESRLYGVGVGKQNEQFQKVITTIHRQRLDNATLANMLQLIIKKTSGYGPNEPLFPGKMWFVDNPESDIRELKLSDTYNVTINQEEYVNHYAEKRHGANELVVGASQQGTPGTATSDLTRLAEANKKFDLILKNIRRWLSPVGVDILANFQQFGDQERHWIIEGPEKGKYIEQFLQMPPTQIRQGAFVELNVTDSITNRDVSQQQWMGLFTILTNYYDKQSERAYTLAQLTGNPLFAEAAVAIGVSAIRSGDYAIKRLVETFPEARIEIEKLLLMPEAEAILNATAQMGAAGAASGGGGANQPTGMAQLVTAARNGALQPQPSNPGGAEQGNSVESNPAA